MISALLPWGSFAVAALLTPRLTRPDLFFAVTVDPSFRQTSAGREILRRYDRSVIVIGLGAFLLVGLARFGSPVIVLAGLLGPVIVELVGWFAVFLAARRRVLPHRAEATTAREAALLPRPLAVPGGWPVQAGPFLILAVIFVLLGWRWDSIPARIPIHWGISGAPDGWAARSPVSVFGAAAIGVLICLLLAWLWHGCLRGVRRIHGTGPQSLGEARFLRTVSLFFLGTEYWLALLMGLVSLAALRSSPDSPLPAFWPILLGQALLIGIIFAAAFRAGQGGWRLAAASGNMAPPGAAPVGDRTPDECWKYGVFYVNRNDPALWVEKRFGVGWTLNFANPRSILVLGAILLFVAASITIGLMASRSP